MKILFPSYQHLTASLIGLSLPMTIMAQSSQALTGGEVNQLAEQVTVFIQGVENKGNFGSGVIIKRSGNTYTVLTAAHVLDNSANYTVTTPDSFQHKIQQIRRIPTVDLASFQFESSKTYQIAKSGDSNSVNPTDKVYVTGFPKPGYTISTPTYTITDGNVTTVLRSGIQDGYGFAYTNPTRAGMSGGPVFNEAAEVIAIHGRKEGEKDGSVPSGAWLNLGIPIRFSKASGIKNPSQVGGGSIQQETKVSKTITPKIAATQQPLKLKPFNVVQPVRPSVKSTTSLEPNATKQCRKVKVNGIVDQDCRTVVKVPNLQAPVQESSTTATGQQSDIIFDLVSSGNQSLATKDYVGAVQYFNRAIEVDPRHGVAYFNRGIAYYYLGNRQQSQSDFRVSSQLFKSVNDQYKWSKVEQILTKMN